MQMNTKALTVLPLRDYLIKVPYRNFETIIKILQSSPQSSVTMYC